MASSSSRCGCDSSASRRFCCCPTTGHRKWRCRRRIEEARAKGRRRRNKFAPSNRLAANLICSPDIGLSRRPSPPHPLDPIFHDKKQEKKCKRFAPAKRKPNEVLGLPLTRLWLLFVATAAAAPDVLAIIAVSAKRRKRDNLISCCCYCCCCWPQQFKQKPRQHSGRNGCIGRSEIIFIEFNYHNNKLAPCPCLASSCSRWSLPASAGQRISCQLLLACDDNSCDCWPVIIQPPLLPTRGRPLSTPPPPRAERHLPSDEHLLFRVGGISGGPSDIITSLELHFLHYCCCCCGGKPNSVRDSTTISLVTDTSGANVSTDATGRAPTKKEASSGLELIAPVLLLQLNLLCPQRCWNDTEPITDRGSGGGREGEGRQLNKDKRIVSWRCKQNKRMKEDKSINQEPECVIANDDYETNKAKRDNDDHYGWRARCSQLLICIDHWQWLGRNRIETLMSFIGLQLSAVSSGGSSINNDPNNSASNLSKFWANLLSLLLARVVEDTGKLPPPARQRKSLNNVAHYCCYHHHHYCRCYDYYSDYHCYGFGLKPLAPPPNRQDNADSPNDGDRRNIGTLHCVEPIRPSPSSSACNELITDSNNNNNNTTVIRPNVQRRPPLAPINSSGFSPSPPVGGLPLRQVGGTEIGLQHKVRQVLLSGIRSKRKVPLPLRAAYFGPLLLLLLLPLLCKLQTGPLPVAAFGPSIMGHDDTGAGRRTSTSGSATVVAAASSEGRWDASAAELVRRSRPLWSWRSEAEHGHHRHHPQPKGQLLSLSSSSSSSSSLSSNSRWPTNKTSNEQHDKIAPRGAAATAATARTKSDEGQIERIESSLWTALADQAAEWSSSLAEKTRSTKEKEQYAITSTTTIDDSLRHGEPLRRTGSHSGHAEARSRNAADRLLISRRRMHDECGSFSTSSRLIAPKDRWRPEEGHDHSSRVIDKRSTLMQQQQQQHQNKRQRIFTTGQHHGLSTVDSSHPPRDSNQSRDQLCPSRCQCVWKNGKQFADCSQQRLSAIPSGLDPLLQVLNMSSNVISHLQANAFNSVQLNNLQKIFLSNCQLETIDLGAFENLKLVVELDFSWNRMQFVPLSQISRMSLLRKLSMRGNPLKSLTETTFSLPANSTAATGEILNLADQRSAGGSSSMSRLYETYPILARSLLLSTKRELLLSQRQTSATSSSANRELEDSFIIEQMELELLESIVRQHEQIGDDLEQELEGEDGGGGDDNNDDGLAGSSQRQDSLSNDPNELNQVLSGRKRRRRSLAAAATTKSARNRPLRWTGGLGGHFNQLQELDFGQCRLTYIKWSVFDQLDQLKRLHLDGNQLSQLSGKLVETFPLGLHQLSLEENPWVCDCRLLTLKRWLQSTRTPLSAPVKCSRVVANAGQATNQEGNNNQPEEEGEQEQDLKLSNSITNLSPMLTSAEVDNSLIGGVGGGGHEDKDGRRQEAYLDRLALDNFVCSPQAAPSWPSAQSGPSGGGGGGTIKTLSRPNLASILEYLEPTLINQGPTETDISINNTKAKLLVANTKLAEANEGDPVQLSCTFLAHPDWSLRVLWTADYSSSLSSSSSTINQAQQILHQASSSSSKSTPSQILYDSHLDARETATTNRALDKQQKRGTKRPPDRIRFEQSNWLAGERNWTDTREPITVLRRDQTTTTTTATTAQQSLDGSVSLTMRLTIDSASPSDAARYKCLVVNRAGQSSLEISLRVQAKPAVATLANSSSSSSAPDSSNNNNSKLSGRDQRSWQDQVNKLRTEQSAGAQSQTLADAAANAAAVKQHLQYQQQQQQQQHQQQQQQQQMQSQSSQQSIGSSWLKGSTTFQVTIVIVSCLMAVVIIAFILFCIIIYQIKPSGAATGGGGTLVDYLTSPSSTFGAQKQFFTGQLPAANGSLIMANGLGAGSIYGTSATATATTTTPLLAAAAAVTDPVTGQTPVHFIAAHPIFQPANQVASLNFVGGLAAAAAAVANRQAINNHAFLAATTTNAPHELSQQEQESIRMVTNWNMTTQTANTTTTTTSLSPRNSYTPTNTSTGSRHSMGQSVENWPEQSQIQQQRTNNDPNNNSYPPPPFA